MPAGPIDPTNQGPADPATVQLDEAAAEHVEFVQALPDVGSARQKAQVRSVYVDMALRIIMSLVLALIFVRLNRSVMSFIEHVYNTELQATATAIAAGKTPVERVVTAQVLMSLVGATAVQVGLAIAAIVSYLFPKNRSTE